MRISDDCDFRAFFNSSIDIVNIDCNMDLTVIRENINLSDLLSVPKKSLSTPKMLDNATPVSHEDITTNDSKEGPVMPIQSRNVVACESDEDWKPIEHDVSDGSWYSSIFFSKLNSKTKKTKSSSADSSVDGWTVCAVKSNKFANSDTLLDVPKQFRKLKFNHHPFFILISRIH